MFFTFRHHCACAGLPERSIGTLGLPPCSIKRLYPHQKFGHPDGPVYFDIHIYLKCTLALSPVRRQSASIFKIEAVCLIGPQCTIA